MKRIYLVLLLVIQLGFGQKDKNNTVLFNSTIGLEAKSNCFFGDNYLAKGHKNPSIGLNINCNFLEYKKFLFGVSIERSTINVMDYSIGGNINKSNIAVYNLNLCRQIPINSKLSLDPNIFYGQLNIKQKNGIKNYGIQDGKDLGIGVCLNYKINKSIKLYSDVTLSHYFLTAHTSPEFENYFNSSNCLSLSLGCKFL